MTKQTEQQHSLFKGPLLALAGYAVFSTHDSILKLLGGDYSIFQIIFFAMLFGYVPFSLARIIDSNPGLIKANNLKLVLSRSFLMVGSLFSAFLAFSMLPLVEVYVLIFIAPLLISVMAIYFLNEKVYLFRWLAIFLGLIGIIIVLRPTVDSLSIGHFLGLLAAFCSAGAAIISRKVGNSENAATLILYPLITSIIATGCILPFIYKEMPLQDLGLMFLIGVLAQIGQLCILFAYRASSAAYIAPMQYSQIIWAIIFGNLFFNEQVDRWVIIGASITILSGVSILWREGKTSKVKPNLRTRNTRMVSAPSAPIRENDPSKS